MCGVRLTMRPAGAASLMLTPLMSVTTTSPRAGRQASAQSSDRQSRYIPPPCRRRRLFAAGREPARSLQSAAVAQQGPWDNHSTKHAAF
jgi:hypothetical protein